jgi:hypothetical protein
MPHNSAAKRPVAPLTQTSYYPDNLLPDIQTMLAALADIEVQYRIEKEQLQNWTGPKAVKEQFAVQIEERYQRERRSYDEQLAALHHRMLAVMELEDIYRTT